MLTLLLFFGATASFPFISRDGTPFHGMERHFAGLEHHFTGWSVISREGTPFHGMEHFLTNAVSAISTWKSPRGLKSGLAGPGRAGPGRAMATKISKIMTLLIARALINISMIHTYIAR